MLTYYDQTLGKMRLKRRYKYSAFAFAAGILVGALLKALL